MDQQQPSNSYNGNIRLRRSGSIHQYSQYEVDELLRCRDDIGYFLENYVKIINLDEGMVNFAPYDYQREMIDIMDKNRFSIFLTARQMGKSVIVAGYLLHAALFNDNSTIAILANKADQSREIMDRIQLMYENLPLWMQPGVSVWNKGDIELGNGTKVFCAATSSSSIRGRSVSLLYLDEFAFVENDIEFYTSTYPVVTAGKSTKVIITSTPNGMNLFYKLWTDAINKRNDYAYLEVHWSRHPERDEAWKEQQLRNMSEKQFHQEFENRFLGSADTLISGTKLEQLAYIEPIKQDAYLKIYHEASKDRSYAVTVDVSEGIGKDYSVATVIDCTEKPFRIAAVYRSNIVSPLVLADVCFKLGKMYNDAVIIVETNNYGRIVTDCLWYDYEYDNLLTSIHKQSENTAWSGSKAEVGIRTTQKTKLIGCSNLKSMVESDTLIIDSFDAIQELTTFIKKGRSFEAEKNKNDDIVMTLVIFAWFASQTYFADMVDLNVRDIVRQNLLAQDEYSMPMPVFDDGIEEVFEDLSLIATRSNHTNEISGNELLVHQNPNW